MRTTFEYVDGTTYVIAELVKAATDPVEHGRNLDYGDVIVRYDGDLARPGTRTYVADVKRGWLRLVEQTWTDADGWEDVPDSGRSIRVGRLGPVRRMRDQSARADFLRPGWAPDGDQVQALGGVAWTVVDHTGDRAKGAAIILYLNECERLGGVVEWRGDNVHRVSALGPELVDNVRRMLRGSFDCAESQGATVTDGDTVADAIADDRAWIAARCAGFTPVDRYPSECAACRMDKSLHSEATEAYESPWSAV